VLIAEPAVSAAMRAHAASSWAVAALRPPPLGDLVQVDEGVGQSALDGRNIHPHRQQGEAATEPLGQGDAAADGPVGVASG
jgi:hypothetical protein